MTLPDLEKLHIVHLPNPVLREVCTPVTEFGGALAAFTARMLELMHEGRGVGLAAPQVGVPIRLFVCNHTGQPEDNLIVINPELKELTGSEESEEGCLSLPGVVVMMRRATRVVMQSRDADGGPCELAAEGLKARIWQHENDHLDGRMICDTMSTADEIANRRAMKMLQDGKTPPRC